MISSRAITTDVLITSIVRWLHVLSAVALVGGVLFLRVVLLPAVREGLPGQADDLRDDLRDAVMKRWKKIVMVSTLLLILSGFYNFFTLSIEKANSLGEAKGLYHGLFGAKVLAALVVFFLTAALCGRSKAFAGMRANPGKWLAINLLLGVLVVLLGGILKSLG